MSTFFGDLLAVYEDLVDQVAEDADSVRTAIKSHGARLGAKQREALEGIREETADLAAIVDELLGPSPAAIKSVSAPLASAGVTTNVGGAIKALGSGYVGGYLVKFGGRGDLSNYRDVFTKSTYYGRSKRVDAYLHHAMLDTPRGDQPLTNEAELGMDDVGVTVKLLLDLRNRYEKALHDLVEQNKLGWSSGAPAHLVKRVRLSSGAHEVRRWPIAESSLTPSPASGGGTEARTAMKSLLLNAGVNVYQAPVAAKRMLIPGGPSGSMVEVVDDDPSVVVSPDIGLIRLPPHLVRR